MVSKRLQRINQDFKKELSTLIPALKDPRIDSFLSVMQVDVSGDLSYAKVYVGSINGSAVAEEACEVLQSASGHLKSELAKILRIRKIPELLFIPDNSAEYAAKIDDIIKGFDK